MLARELHCKGLIYQNKRMTAVFCYARLKQGMAISFNGLLRL